MTREIILDTETTGVDPASGHRVVEIGCIEMLSGCRTGNFFHTYLNPQRDMPMEAERIHGLSSAFLADKPTFAEKVDEFLEFIDDSLLVIHNAAFDMKFINAELAATGFPALPMSRSLDTVLMARKKFPGSPASLDALCKRFAIDLSGRTKHGALLDAELLAEVYIELMGGRQSLLFAEAKPARNETDSVISDTEKTLLTSRLFPVSAEELEAHKALVERIKNPVWAEE